MSNTVAISDFKARCIELMNEASRNGTALVVTRRGKPLARVEGIKPEESGRRLGALNSMTLHGDIIRSDFNMDWE